MGRAFTNDVFRVPLTGGPVARIRVQRYDEDRVVWFSAEPGEGDKDEAMALAAIALLKEEVERAGYEPRVAYRRRRPDGPGMGFVDILDAIRLEDVSDETEALLGLIQQAAALTVH